MRTADVPMEVLGLEIEGKASANSRLERGEMSRTASSGRSVGGIKGVSNLAARLKRPDLTHD